MQKKPKFSNLSWFLFLINLFAQESYPQKVSASITLSTTDGGSNEILPGIEFSYYKGITNKIGLSLAVEHGYFNSISRNSDDYKNTEVKNPLGDLMKEEKNELDNKRINQMILSLNAHYTLFKMKKSSLYFSAGLGYNLQDILYESGVEKILHYSSQTIKNYDQVKYTPRSFENYILLMGAGYDYSINKSWFIGIDLRGQFA